MNIIEAMQKAEQGKLITNNFLKISNNVLKYVRNGEFEQYEIIDGILNYRFKVTQFTYAFIISIGWEVVEGDYYLKPQRKSTNPIFNSKK